MRKIGLGQGITILANVGVLVGILLLVFELNQNREMMRAQTRTSVSEGLTNYLTTIGSDPERAGGLEPLRLLPKGAKRVLPGFITTKSAELESLDDLKRRFDEAGKYADTSQLGIAPQCGFL